MENEDTHATKGLSNSGFDNATSRSVGPEADSDTSSHMETAQIDATRFIIEDDVDFGPSGSPRFPMHPQGAAFGQASPGNSGPEWMRPANNGHSDTVPAVEPNSASGATLDGATTTTSPVKPYRIVIALLLAIIAIAAATMAATSLNAAKEDPTSESQAVSQESSPSQKAASQEDETVTISFETGGGSTVKALKIASHETAVSPENPTKPGYRFAGWYYDQECKQQAEFPLKDVTEDMLLFAKWEEEPAEEDRPEESEGTESSDNNQADSAVESTAEEASPPANEPIAPPAAQSYAQPFWGAWVYASKDANEAEQYAADLASQGYNAQVVLSSDWSNLNSEPWYCVTAGRYASEADASAAAAALSENGYDGAYAKYSGEQIA